ncbi:MAG: FtsX-like permease family protein [Pseudomonadota bacterium]
MRTFFRLLGRGIADLALHPFANFVGLVTMTLATFLGGVCLLALTTVDKELSTARSETVWQLFWSADADMTEVQAQWDALRQTPWLVRMQTWTPQQAFDGLAARLESEGKANALAQLGSRDKSPLPATAQLVFMPQIPDTNSWAQATLAQLEALPTVTRVTSTPLKDELSRVWRGMSIFIIWPAIAFLCLVLALIAANTVRTMFMEQRDEIAILRLVGATKAYIRIPLLVSGVFMGLLAGTLASAALYVLFLNFGHLIALPPVIMQLHFPPLEHAALLLAMPVLMGFFGGCLAVRGR